MKTLLLCVAFVITCLLPATGQQKFDAFSDKFVTGYKQLKLPQLELSYVIG